MRHWIPSRVAVFQGLTVLALLVPVIVSGWYVWIQHQHILESIAVVEPRYARFLGLADRKVALVAASQEAKERIKMSIYPPDQDAAVAGNDAQQRIRALFADSQLDVGSIQVLPAKEEDGFDRIAIELRVEGDLTGMQNALSLLAAQRPIVVVNEVNVQTIGAVRPASAQRLAGQFVFSVLRGRP